MPESGEPLPLTEDDDLPLSITHSRDTIAFDGKIEQDYRFLNYRFKGRDGDIIARMYLDDPWTVSIIEPMNCETLDADMPNPAKAAGESYAWRPLDPGHGGRCGAGAF
jgi:hypothetical protein